MKGVRSDVGGRRRYRVSARAWEKLHEYNIVCKSAGIFSIINKCKQNMWPSILADRGGQDCICVRV